MTTPLLYVQIMSLVEMRLERARRATPGPWLHVDYAGYDGEVPTNHGCGSVITMAQAVLGGDIANPAGDCYPRSGYSPLEDMDFIAAEDPASIQLHCYRDLKILRRHVPAYRSSGDEAWDRAAFCDWCGTGRVWPCIEITDLAIAYEIEVQ